MKVGRQVRLIHAWSDARTYLSDKIRKFQITLALDFDEFVLAFLSSDGVTQVRRSVVR